MIIDVDLSSLEVRVAAFLSQDQVMIKELVEGLDMHQHNAETFFGKGDPDTRTLAKIFSFRIIYGGSAYAFYMDHKMPKLPLKKWEEIVENFYGKYYGLKCWQDKNFQTVLKQGYLVNPTGRILTFQKHLKGGVMMYGRPDVCNYPVQSLATADIVPLAMVVIHRRLKKEGLHDVKMINQVHDSIIFDAPKKDVDKTCEICITVFRELPKLIESYFGFKYNVPMDGEAKFGNNWNELVKWKFK